MTISRKVREKVFELLKEGYSPEKIVDVLSRDSDWNKEDVPTPKTIRNWLKQSAVKKPVLTGREKDLARQRDILIFKKSDEILKEGNVIYYTDKLQTPDWPYRSSILDKIAEYCHYFSLEGNKYIDNQISELCDKFINALITVHDLAATYYFTEGDRTVFMPAGYQHYLNGTDEGQPEYKEAARQLATLAKKTYKAYINYRNAIKTTLYI